MIYSQTADDIFCALYAGSTTEIVLEKGKVKLEQTTAYPFDGKINIVVTPENEGAEFTLWLRIPTWNTDRFIPGELYRYADESKSSASVKVNGKKVLAAVTDGYFPVKRSWKTGDKVELELDMPVRYNVADERVEADVNRICLTKGPILYCAEEPDNQDNPSLIIMDGNSTEFKEGQLEDGVMKGIPVISVNASAAKLNGTIRNTVVKLIPYYSWNNRGDWKKMNVWFARDRETAVSNIPTIPGKIIDVHATRISDDIYGPVDGQIPSSSADESIPRWTSYNDLGLSQQYFIYLEEEQEIKSIKVYWHDNNDDVKIPASWTIDYHTNGEWKEFKPCSTDIFGIAKDEFNMVRPDHAVKADAIRLNIVAQKDACVGILETTIE